MRKMKDSGVEWIDVIPEDWSIVPLKTAVSFGKGLPITKENLIEKGVAVVSYGQIHSKSNIGSHLKEELVRYVSEDYLISNPNCLAKKGDIFVADTSEDYEGIGNSVLVDWDENVFAGYHTVIISPTNRKYSKYLSYLFMTDAWRSQLRSRASGIKVFSVTQGLLRKSAVILPDEKSVQCITDYLDEKCSKIDAIIARQEEIIEKLKEYKLSIITEVVTRGVNPEVEIKESGIAICDQIPSNWEVSQIRHLFQLRDEKNYKPLEEVQLLSLYTDLGVFPHGEQEERGNKAVKAEGYKVVYDDDIVVNIILAWMGAIGRSAYNGVTSPAYDTYKPLDGVCSEYYHYLFRTKVFSGECYKYGRGIMAMRWRTYSSEFKSIKVPVPPYEEQVQIAEHIDKKCEKIDKTISDRQTAIEKLKQYKKSLIYEVVTGKKEV